MPCIINLEALAMHNNSSSLEWASELFGGCGLGDSRRTQRLVQLAALMADHAGQSLNAACDGREAEVEASYRLIRNSHIALSAMTEPAFQATANRARQTSPETILLALEDTTTLSYAHGVAKKLGDTGGPKSSSRGGLLAHSVLAVEAESGAVLGLLEQERWTRSRERQPRGAHKKKPYAKKESFKWQRASERIAQRLDAETLQRMVSVCDREADIHEYLQYKVTRRERFVVRACRDRKLKDAVARLLFAEVESRPVMCEVSVAVAQRGGRPARTARVGLRWTNVMLAAGSCGIAGREAMALGVVEARENHPPDGTEALHWRLLTNERVESAQDAQRIVAWYRRRWLVEEFHKAWKTGCGVEKLRMRERATLERMVVILAFVATRLLELRQLQEAEPEATCDRILERDEWVCLWRLSPTTRGQPLPAQPPTLSWALLEIARLGGYYKTTVWKRPGWQTLWRGYQRLMDRVEGMRAARDHP